MKTILVLVFMLIAHSLNSQELTIITENAPPNAFMEHGQVSGKAVEIVQAVLNEIGMDGHKIVMYPWARGYNMLQNQKNVVLFPTSRTEHREPLFKWAGPISDNTVNLYKLKARTDIRAGSLEDLKKYRVGSTRNDQKSQYLLSKGFDVQFVNEDKLNIAKLFLGRIEIMPYATTRLQYDLNQSGYDRNQIKLIWHLTEISTQNHVAFSQSTDDKIVENFQKGFNAIKKKGIQDKILQKWKTRFENSE